MEDFARGVWKDLVLSEPNYVWGTSWTSIEKYLKPGFVSPSGWDV